MLLILAVVALVGWRTTSQRLAEGEARLRRTEGQLQRIAERQEDAEASARSLVDALGRLCANFDFFFKHDMARGSFRPVRCSLAGVERTVLFAYGFDTTATQAAWVGEWGNLSDQRGAMLVESGTWAVEVLDPDIAREVRSIFLSSA
jgi:hypothetical protein